MRCKHQEGSSHAILRYRVRDVRSVLEHPRARDAAIIGVMAAVHVPRDGPHIVTPHVGVLMSSRNSKRTQAVYGELLVGPD